MTKIDIADRVTEWLAAQDGSPAGAFTRIVGTAGEGQAVDFSYGNAVIRIRKEAGWYEVLFGSVFDAEWFGSAEVLEFVHSSEATLDSEDVDEALTALRCFLTQFGYELSRAFGSECYLKAKELLFAVRAARNRRLWPSSRTF